MEVRIRLQKIGKAANRSANYRIVAISRTSTRDGRHLEILGHYDPTKKPAVLVMNREKVENWVKKGARLSDTVRSLLLKVK